jgi:LPPG:FO 2-phospho-L-lactate transferase
VTDDILNSDKEVVAICGGVGGAKLALGLLHLFGDRLTVVVNVGDDFDHLGLRICPDLDTVLYTLGGLNDEVRGWGRSGESWNFMDSLRQLGGEDWFLLGDKDLAIHIERTRRLAAGQTLTACIDAMRQSIGIAGRILPATDDFLRTKVATDEGLLDFQRYFVARRCQPRVHSISFAGSDQTKPSSKVLDVLRSPRVGMIVLCPSNPYLSIDPILAVAGMRELLKANGAPIVAVSPIIAGQAVKGPTVKIMEELSIEVTTQSIAKHYDGLIDGLLIDHADLGSAEGLAVPVHFAATLMRDLAGKIRLARETAAFAERLPKRDRVQPT